MNQKCEGKNCNSTDGNNHSVECLFEHFTAYTRAYKESDETLAKLKKAYFDGHEAGSANTELAFDAMWPFLRREREWRLEDRECGGPEISESLDTLKAQVIKAINDSNAEVSR